jgi:hypothetical protein
VQCSISTASTVPDFRQHSSIGSIKIVWLKNSACYSSVARKPTPDGKAGHVSPTWGGGCWNGVQIGSKFDIYNLFLFLAWVRPHLRESTWNRPWSHVPHRGASLLHRIFSRKQKWQGQVAFLDWDCAMPVAVKQHELFIYRQVSSSQGYTAKSP